MVLRSDRLTNNVSPKLSFMCKFVVRRSRQESNYDAIDTEGAKSKQEEVVAKSETRIKAYPTRVAGSIDSLNNCDYAGTEQLEMCWVDASSGAIYIYLEESNEFSDEAWLLMDDGRNYELMPEPMTPPTKKAGCYIGSYKANGKRHMAGTQGADETPETHLLTHQIIYKVLTHEQEPHKVMFYELQLTGEAQQLKMDSLEGSVAKHEIADLKQQRQQSESNAEITRLTKHINKVDAVTIESLANKCEAERARIGEHDNQMNALNMDKGTFLGSSLETSDGFDIKHYANKVIKRSSLDMFHEIKISELLRHSAKQMKVPLREPNIINIKHNTMREPILGFEANLEPCHDTDNPMAAVKGNLNCIIEVQHKQKRNTQAQTAKLHGIYERIKKTPMARAKRASKLDEETKPTQQAQGCQTENWKTADLRPWRQGSRGEPQPQRHPYVAQQPQDRLLHGQHQRLKTVNQLLQWSNQPTADDVKQPRNRRPLIRMCDRHGIDTPSQESTALNINNKALEEEVVAEYAEYE